MRVIAALWLSTLLVCSASAQPPGAPAPASAPPAPEKAATYFLVDASRSMEERERPDGPTKQQEAQAALDARIALLAKQDPDAPTYRAFFGGLTTTACDAPVSIGKPTAAKEVTPAPPTPWGPTQLGAALDAALEHVGTKPASIVIITDGSESCKVDLCSVALERLPGLPNVKVDVELIQERRADTTRLACVANAQIREGTPSTPTGSGTDQCEWVGRYLWLPGFFLSIFLIVVAGIAGTYAAALGRRAAQWDEKKKEKEKEKKAQSGDATAATSPGTNTEAVAETQATEKKPKLVDGKLTWALLIASAVGSVISFGWLQFTPCGWPQWWTAFEAFAEGNFGSKFLPGVFVSFVGWVLLQFWGVLQARQTKTNNEFLEHLQDRAYKKRQSDDAVRDSNRRTQLVAEIRSRKALADHEEEQLRNAPPTVRAYEAAPQDNTTPEFAARLARGNALRARMVDAVCAISDLSRLRKYAGFNWTSYWRIVDALERDGLLTTADELELKAIFDQWHSFLGRRAVSDAWRNRIDGFAVERIKDPPKTTGAGE